MTEIELKKELELYKKMYCCLFNAITAALEQNDYKDVKKLLITAQQKTEDIYING
jgi:hypothetical protein